MRGRGKNRRWIMNMKRREMEEEEEAGEEEKRT